MVAVSWALNQHAIFKRFFTFVHNVASTVSYDWKELLEIRTVITHHELDKDFFFNKSGENDLLQIPYQAQIPILRMKKRHRYTGGKSWCLVRICLQAGNPPLTSVLLANVQSLENKLDELCSRPFYQRILKPIISHVSPSRGWTTTWIIRSLLVFPCFGKREQLPPVRQGVVVSVYLLITKLILRVFRGFARLR